MCRRTGYLLQIQGFLYNLCLTRFSLKIFDVNYKKLMGKKTLTWVSILLFYIQQIEQIEIVYSPFFNFDDIH
jgi:hypothetical protein